MKHLAFTFLFYFLAHFSLFAQEVPAVYSNIIFDENGNLIADPIKFPSGMKALAKYIHSKGLKFGLITNGLAIVAFWNFSSRFTIRPR